MAQMGDDSEGEGEEEVGDGRDFLLTDDAKDIDLRYESGYFDSFQHCLHTLTQWHLIAFCCYMHTCTQMRMCPSKHHTAVSQQG